MKNHEFQANVFMTIDEKFEWTFYCVDCGGRFVLIRNNLDMTEPIRTSPMDYEIVEGGLNKDCNVEIVKKVLSV